MLTCPCHLPLVVALLGGTVAGGVIAENMSLAVLALTAVFLASGWAAVRMFTRAAVPGERSPTIR